MISAASPTSNTGTPATNSAAWPIAPTAKKAAPKITKSQAAEAHLTTDHQIWRRAGSVGTTGLSRLRISPPERAWTPQPLAAIMPDDSRPRAHRRIRSFRKRSGN